MSSSLNRVVRKAGALHAKLLQAVCRTRPVSLNYWLLLHRLVKRLIDDEDPLFPADLPVDPGTSLRAPELQQLLRSDALGEWSLDCATIDLLWRKLLDHRPQGVIECGTGASTLVLAKYVALSTRRGAAACSLEQNIPFKNEIERRLSASGLRDYVQIICAPLSAGDMYDRNAVQQAAPLGTRKADLLLIDGPAGRPGCRVWTLPLLARFCHPGARWLLDDAFRDGELWVLDVWARLPGVSVAGIHPIGKGLATGSMTDPSTISFDSVRAAIKAAEHRIPRAVVRSIWESGEVTSA